MFLPIIRMLFGVSVWVVHHGSRDRPGLRICVADLTLDESSLLAALREFAIEPLEALSLLI